MTDTPLQQALEKIYDSLFNNNKDIDLHIEELKLALGADKTVVIDPARLVENTRQGRRLMQSYFKRRGVIVTFS